VRRAAAAALVVAAVVLIYARSTTGYFFDDDFHWLEQTQSFAPVNMLDLSRYDHFYRPVIELYFFAGLSWFGCDPFGFHVTSIVVHLLTTVFVYLFARALPASALFAFLSALFFAVQPGLTDAVTWIAAITDELPGLWYVLTLWLHRRFLDRRTPGWYAGALTAFALCHLTHESAATLLPMMLLVDLFFATEGALRHRLVALARQWTIYLPFAVVLAAFLAIAWIVNTRSYLVQEGHYALGWHALPNILNYILWLYVGQRAVLDYVATVTALAAALLWGTDRLRFSVIWIVLTLLPVSLFTWENAARYLYLPAVGFAMLAAELLALLKAAVAHRRSPVAARLVVWTVVAILAIRFGSFAKKAADSFPARAAAYERFAAALRRDAATARPGEAVVIEQRFLEGVPELYRQPAARIALCVPGVRLEMR
jgi:hypothetical protein